MYKATRELSRRTKKEVHKTDDGDDDDGDDAMIHSACVFVCVWMGECTVYFHLMYYRFDWQISLGYWSTRLSIEHKIVVCILT